jgi:hypothetical protein
LPGVVGSFLFQPEFRVRRTNCCDIGSCPIGAGLRTSLKTTRSPISIGLALALTLILPVETLPAQDQDRTPPPAGLNLVIVEGDGAINNIRQRVSRDPIVRVEDTNRKPIAGAVVVFTLPTEGATGEFGGGSKSITVNTDAQGLAKAPGLKLGGIGGKLPIRVTASYRGVTSTITMTQFIEVPAGMKPSTSSGGGHGKLIAILAVVGGAAAGGAIYATQRKSGTTTVTPSTPTPSGPTPIGITAGTGTISPPR